MSVLLDALKKSEEEKKKSEGEAAASPEGGAEAGSKDEAPSSSSQASPAPSAPEASTQAPAKPAGGGGIGKLGMFSHSAPVPKPHVTKRPASGGVAAPGMAPPLGAAKPAAKAPGMAPPLGAAKPGAKAPGMAPPLGAAKPGAKAPGMAPPAGAAAPAPSMNIAPKPPAAAAVPPPTLSKPAEDSKGAFDFDSIDEPAPASGTAGTKLAARTPQAVESRTVAGSVVGAGESAVDAAEPVVSSGSGGTFKLALAAAALVAVGGGAYYIIFSGPSVSTTTSGTAAQSGSGTGQSGQEGIDPADQLPLPNPNIDIQSELVSFASYTESNSSIQGSADVADRIAVLTSSFLEEDSSLPLNDGDASSEEIDLSIADPVVDAENAGAASFEIDPATFPLVNARESQDELADKGMEVDLGAGVRLYAVTQEQIPEASPEETSETQQAEVSAPVSSIMLETSEKADVVRRLLDEAKREFDAGNLASAEVAFRKILADDLNNVNAMKGLAMVASETGRYRLAASIYLKVLDLQSDDAVAISELISLHSRQADYSLTERRLKSLLGRVPAHDNRLYFALGNIYAEQGRWFDAQQQYFNAYSSDSGNPDYAFNLAVSLEYVGRQDIALNYYKIAQELAGAKAHSFEDSVLTTRILQLDN